MITLSPRSASHSESVSYSMFPGSGERKVTKSLSVGRRSFIEGGGERREGREGDGGRGKEEEECWEGEGEGEGEAGEGRLGEVKQ